MRESSNAQTYQFGGSLTARFCDRADAILILTPLTSTSTFNSPLPHPGFVPLNVPCAYTERPAGLAERALSSTPEVALVVAGARGGIKHKPGISFALTKLGARVAIGVVSGEFASPGLSLSLSLTSSRRPFTESVWSRLRLSLSCLCEFGSTKSGRI